MKQFKILIIEDEKLIRWSLEKHLSSRGNLVFTADSGEEGIKIFENNYPDVVFLDNKLPNMQGLDVILKLKSLDNEVVIVFMTAYGSIDTAVSAIKMGASEYVNKPFVFDEIDVVLDNIKSKISIDREIQLLRREQKDKVTFDHIIGDSVQFRKIIQLSKKIARTETTTILLLGESGTGKDLLAYAIHNESGRSKKPFVTINCSSLPESLLESELFGHEKGAFTDARQAKKGLFEIADGGTVFLDEIGEINQATQIKLLGVLENRVVRRLGGTLSIPVDIRIIAATNRDLKRAVDAKAFREDLYYRLKVFQLSLPALRERKEDIPALAEFFMKYYNQQFKKSIKKVDSSTIGLLMEYNWPGNIRELRNVMERAVILETMTTLQPDSLPGEIISLNKSYTSDFASSSESLKTEDNNEQLPIDLNTIQAGTSLYEIEKQLIVRALQLTDNNQTRSSKLLGITRDTLRYKIKKYKI